MTTVRSSGIRLQILLSSDQALGQTAASPQTVLGDSDALVNWAHRKDLTLQALLLKRLKGFEPSTFCMASRRSSQLSYSRAQRGG
jgi:hypothetical protein